MSTTVTPHTVATADPGVVLHLPLSQLRVTGANPRKDFEDLSDLDTLRERQLHALLVFPSNVVEGDFDVLDGHRRLAAAKALGLDTLRCEVVAAPEDRGALVADMLVSGTAARPLSLQEVAGGVQDMLDAGWDLPRAEKRLGRQRGLAVSADDWDQSAQITLDTAFLVAEARAELAAAGDTARLEKLEESLADNADSAADIDLYYLMEMSRQERFRDLADQAGAYPVQGAWFPGDTWEESGPELVTDYLGMDSDVSALALAEHAKAGRQYRLRGGHVLWYKRRRPAPDETEGPAGDDETTGEGAAGRPGPADVPAPEPTAEQVAAQELRDAAFISLAKANERRALFLQEVFAKDHPMEGLVAHALLAEKVAERFRGARYKGRKVMHLLSLLGVKGQVDLEDDDAVVKAALATARKRKMPWLVAFMALDDHYAEHIWEQLGSDRGRMGAYTDFLGWAFGFEAGEDERRAMAWPEPWPPVTATCGKCAQEVVATKEWTGVCETCQSA